MALLMWVGDVVGAAFFFLSLCPVVCLSPEALVPPVQRKRDRLGAFLDR